MRAEHAYNQGSKQRMLQRSERLDAPMSENLMFTLSEGLRDALDEYSGTHQVSRAAVIREAIAAHIGYDLAAEPKAPRRKKYVNPEARKAAQRERDKVKRGMMKSIIDAANVEERLRAIASLEAWLGRDKPETEE